MTTKIKKAGIFALVILLVAAAVAVWSFVTPTQKPDNVASVEGAPDTKIVFKDPEFSFQLLRALGSSVYGASDIGECLSTARRITEGDFESWYSEWYKTAERVRGIADEALAKGHHVSAREAYLRAETYYRMSEFYLHGDPEDPRIYEASRKARDSFSKAAALFSPPLEYVKIPYENTALPGYFYRVDDSGKRRPTVIIQTGFDGTQEELYASGAAAALSRGYNVLTFEGPGQGAVIREQGIPFRPDWEAVIIPVMDYVLSRPDIDPKRVALFGISLGGYLAPRGAAYEHRLAALVADGGIYKPADLVSNFGRPFLGPNASTTEVVEYLRNNPDEFDRTIPEIVKNNTNARWFIEHGMFAFRAKTPSEFLIKYSEFSMEGKADKIICPTLIIDSDHDLQLQGQARNLYDRLTCEKKFILFTSAEGAGEHCQMGAFLLAHQRIFDWLDEVFVTPAT
jgi:pimeloyl-ACP methyl ester carboxylesterase